MPGTAAPAGQQVVDALLACLPGWPPEGGAEARV